MHPVTKAWVDASIILAKDKNAKVLCPECERGSLQLKDELIPAWKKIDRYIICDSCGRWNVVTGNYPDSEYFFSEEA